MRTSRGFLFGATVIFILFLALPGLVIGQDAPGKSPIRLAYAKGSLSDSESSISIPSLKGWDYVVSLLAEHGYDRDYLHSVFADKRMPVWSQIYFSVEPKEPKRLYRGRNTKRERKNALKFYKEHAEHFIKAERLYSVPRSVLLAILQVETRCGVFTGRARVLHGLARLVAASEPKNILNNFKRQQRKDSSITLKQVEDRGEWLKQTFLPQLVATFDLATYKSLHPLDLRGSFSGALGLPQFLPDNYFSFGIDADQNGRIDLFSPADAVQSVAHFLNRHGWQSLDKRKDQEEVILHYNRSEPYVNLVLNMASSLEGEISQLEIN